MAQDFYPFVGTTDQTGLSPDGSIVVRYCTRVAIYDDAACAPRVVEIPPGEVRSYLEEITATVNSLSHEQGGHIPFMVTREIVENFIHAAFRSPTISILDKGDTIRFCDQGPGIQEKDRALEYGTTSATEEMRHYIRGVGSGLPYAHQYMQDKGGSLEIEDNISGGTVVTISVHPSDEARSISGVCRKMANTTADVCFTPAKKAGEPEGTEGIRQLGDRERQVLTLLSTTALVGPTDLKRSLGLSDSTWSRVLSRLASAGAIEKTTQKYRLTDYGRTLI